jgi:hypothetical protein
MPPTIRPPLRTKLRFGDGKTHLGTSRQTPFNCTSVRWQYPSKPIAHSHCHRAVAAHRLPSGQVATVILFPSCVDELVIHGASTARKTTFAEPLPVGQGSCLADTMDCEAIGPSNQPILAGMSTHSCPSSRRRTWKWLSTRWLNSRKVLVRDRQ